MSKLLIVYALGAMLAQAETFAAAVRKTGHRVLVRDAEVCLAYGEKPDVKADAVLIPDGPQFDDLQVAYMLAGPEVSVMRGDPDLQLLGQQKQADADPDAVPDGQGGEGGAGEPPVPNAEPPAAEEAAPPPPAPPAEEPAEAAAKMPAEPAPEEAAPPAPEAAHAAHRRRGAK